MTCPFCHSAEGSSLYPITDMFGRTREMVRCTACSVVYLDPKPTDAELNEAYDDSYYGQGESKFREPFESIIEWFRGSRARRIHSKLGGKGSVLDIGCGNGRFLGQLKAMGDYRITGIETGQKAAERAALVDDLTLITQDLLSLKDLPGPFDAITLYHVFEHLPHPAAVLDAIAAMSDKGTLVEISIPNIDSLQARMYRGHWLHHDPPRHLFHMPPRVLRSEMERRGFKLVSRRYLSLEQNPFGRGQSHLNRWLKERDVLLERLKGNTGHAPEHGRVSIMWQTLFMAIFFPFFVLGDFLAAPLGLSATVRMSFRRK